MTGDDLRHRIVLQAKSVTRDAMGGEVITWVDQATVWAAIEPLSARELVAAQQVQPELNTRIGIRYRSDVTAEWRAKYGVRVFTIVGPPVNPKMSNEWLSIPCTEGVLDG